MTDALSTEYALRKGLWEAQGEFSPSVLSSLSSPSSHLTPPPCLLSLLYRILICTTVNAQSGKLFSVNRENGKPTRYPCHWQTSEFITTSRHKFDNNQCLEWRKRNMWSVFHFYFEYSRNLLCRTEFPLAMVYAARARFLDDATSVCELIKNESVKLFNLQEWDYWIGWVNTKQHNNIWHAIIKDDESEIRKF